MFRQIGEIVSRAWGNRLTKPDYRKGRGHVKLTRAGLERAVAMREDGVTYREIAEEVGVSPSTVYRAVRDPDAYTDRLRKAGL